MKERPILYNGQMVRSLLDGSKTMTRRVCKQMNCWVQQECREVGLHDGEPHHFMKGAELPVEQFRCPYGQPGDQLWVRESFYQRDHKGAEIVSGQIVPADKSTISYAADVYTESERASLGRGRPSIHMPRWASRITLEIVSVRVERLQEISASDCWAEGIEYSPDTNPVHEYQELWDWIYGAESWAANPWVWVVEFKRVSEVEA